MLKARVSSAIKSVDLKQEVGPLIIGERLNTQGSKKAKQLVLNDDFDGGETEFPVFGDKVKPEKGKTLIWPADWTHAHSGKVVNSGVKYIITGWMHFTET